MPGQDGTGPLGQGTMTGRGLGPCRRGLGFGRGLGRAIYSFGSEQISLTKEQEKKILQAQLAEIEAEKAIIEKKLKENK